MFFGKRPYKIISTEYIQSKGQTCGKCVYLYERSKTCLITTQCKGYSNICNCGQFKSSTPNWDSLEELDK
jgi:hypothetical protein